MNPQTLTDLIELFIKIVTKKSNNEKEEKKYPLAKPIIEENNMIKYPMARSV